MHIKILCFVYIYVSYFCWFVFSQSFSFCSKTYFAPILFLTRLNKIKLQGASRNLKSMSSGHLFNNISLGGRGGTVSFTFCLLYNLIKNIIRACPLFFLTLTLITTINQFMYTFFTISVNNICVHNACMQISNVEWNFL